jgi:hypothetical protein
MRGVVGLRELEGNVEFRSEELTAVVAVKQEEELVKSGMSDENGDSERERERDTEEEWCLLPNLADGEREEPPI